MNLSEILTNSRKLLNFNQEEVADACQVSRSHWANFEIGKRVPLPDDIPRIAKILGISPKQRDYMIKFAVMHHGGTEVSRLIEGLETQILDSKKEVSGLRAQLSDLVKVLRAQGVRLPESCNDL